MSTEYTKTNWQDGDIITADKMNNIENGIKGIEDVTTTVKDGLQAVEDDVADVKDDLEQIEPGLSDDAKTALLNCFQHVAWIDDRGQTYYDALEDALYADSYPRITAVFDAGVNVIYTDDALDTLKQYLTVKFFATKESTGIVIASNDCTLSGVLVEGTSTVTVAYNGVRTSVSIPGVVNFYNIHEWIYPNGLLTLYGASAAMAPGTGTAREPMINNPTNPATRASWWTTKGRSDQQTTIQQDGTRSLGYYPIPVPDDASNIAASITPSTYYVNIRRFSYNPQTQQWTAGSETGWQLGGCQIEFPLSEERRYITISSKFNSSGTVADLPQGISINYS